MDTVRPTRGRAFLAIAPLSTLLREPPGRSKAHFSLAPQPDAGPLRQADTCRLVDEVNDRSIGKIPPSAEARPDRRPAGPCKTSTAGCRNCCITALGRFPNLVQVPGGHPCPVPRQRGNRWKRRAWICRRQGRHRRCLCRARRHGAGADGERPSRSVQVATESGNSIRRAS